MMLVLNMLRLMMEMTVSEKFGDFVTICDMLGLQVKFWMMLSSIKNYLGK